MVKEFAIMASILILFILSMLLHSWLFESKGIQDAFRSVVAVTHIVEPSFAPSSFEPIVREGKKSQANSIYPELPQINYLDFAYAQ